MTLKQVAERANVSIKTVSRAINGEGYVGAKTRKAVLRAAKEVGYVPNRAARQMRSGDAGIIVMLAHFVSTAPFTTEIMRGVESSVEAADRALLIADSGTGGRDRALRTFREFRVGHVIFATSYHMSAEGLFKPGKEKTVLVNCFLDVPDVTCLVPDDEAGAYTQARHLIERGHERIGIIELPEGMIARALRRRGVRRAYEEAGIAWDDALVRPGQTGPVEARKTVAYEAVMDLLDRPDRPTALLCSKDEFALQAMGAAARLGLRIPEDLSLIGYDDVQVLAATMRPALTTIRLPYFELGRLAAETVLNGSPKPGRHRVGCPLVERQSTAAI